MRSDEPAPAVPEEISLSQRPRSSWRYWARWAADLWLVYVFLILLVLLVWWLVTTFGLGYGCPDYAHCQVGDAIAST